MGEHTKQWDYIATEDDFKALETAEKIYTTNLKRTKSHEIPAVAHFIWLGPKEFPQASKEYVASWVRKHPNMTFKFWTDRPRAAPHPKMETVCFDKYPFQSLKSEYADSDNWAERSDLLRYEILLHQGGLYIDHDVECFQSVESLNQEYDFYCGLEPLHTPIVNSSVTACNNLIGTTPHHPVLKSVIARVKSNWDRATKAYPGKDRDSIIYRVANRTFAPFDDAVRSQGDVAGYRNALLPAGYFNTIEGEFGLFADHKYIGSWYQELDPFEDLVRRNLVKMSKRTNKTLLLCGITLALNLLLGAFLIYVLRRNAQKNA